MRVYERRYFVSWLDGGEKWATALMPINQNWFEVAINVFRGSDRFRPDNVWVTDGINEDEMKTLRPATKAEVESFMNSAWETYLNSFPNIGRPMEMVLDKDPHIIFQLKETYASLPKKQKK